MNTTLAISGNPVEYNVSGLKRYATGIEYGTTLYAASGDAVSLTLGHADVIGQHFTGYEVSGGSSLDDATSDTPTLAMTTANQTISAGYSYNYSWTEDGKYATEFSTVSGSTITITSEAELARLAYLVNNGDNCSGKTYKLGQDLDMSENSWPTIGTSSTRFLGTFDGDGHTISGLHTPSSGLNYAAQIHTSNGTVKNLTIANSSFYGTKYAAAIVCDNRNLVENCRVEGDVIVTCTGQEEGTYSGGVVAYQQNQDSGHGYSESTGVTRGCYSAAQVSGNDRVGGIMGRLASGTVEFSVSEATASSTVTTTRIAYVIGDQKAGSTAQYNYYISDTESSNTTDLRAYPVTLTDKLQQGGFAIVYGTNPNFDKSKLYFSRGQFSGTYYVGQFKVGDKWYAPKTINVSNSQTSDYYVKFYFTLTKEVDGYEVATVENVTVNDVAPSTENDNYRFEVNGAAIISGDPAITLYDNGELNEFYLTHNNGLTANVKLSGRTLIKDDNWNTLCLPFSIDDMNIDDTPLAGAKLMSLANVNSNTGFDSSTGTLTLDFVEAGEIEAGVAYIVKWETTGDPIENPVFEGVTITTDNPADRKTTSQDEKVSFVGTYTPLSYTNKETSVLFLGDGSTLYYPNGSNPTTIGAFRAYFQLNGITASESSSGVRAFNLNFGECETTGILSTTNLTNYTNSGAWYDLSGRRLSSKPSAKGLYIHGGNKVVIK